MSDAMIAPGPKTFSQSKGRRGSTPEGLRPISADFDVSSIFGPKYAGFKGKREGRYCENWNNARK
ncbi:MAG: hypothetical protein RQ760_05475 [Sedimentisphaerales bacterium]|nr:hypothetical protein [Sedimentisphaerales bacterium]